MSEKEYSKEKLKVKFRKDILGSSDYDFSLKRLLLVRTLDYFSDFNSSKYLGKKLLFHMASLSRCFEKY